MDESGVRRLRKALAVVGAQPRAQLNMKASASDCGAIFSWKERDEGRERNDEFDQKRWKMKVKKGGHQAKKLGNVGRGA